MPETSAVAVTVDAEAIAADLSRVCVLAATTVDAEAIVADLSLVWVDVPETVEVLEMAAVRSNVVDVPAVAVTVDTLVMAAVRPRVWVDVPETADVLEMAEARSSVRVAAPVTVDALVIAADRWNVVPPPVTVAVAATVEADVIAAVASYWTSSSAVSVWPTATVPVTRGRSVLYETPLLSVTVQSIRPTAEVEVIAALRSNVVAASETVIVGIVVSVSLAVPPSVTRSWIVSLLATCALSIVRQSVCSFLLF